MNFTTDTPSMNGTPPMIIRVLRAVVVVAVFAVFSSILATQDLQAEISGFSGYYAPGNPPGNWTFDPTAGNGTVNTSSAPTSITLIGSGDTGGVPTAVDTDYYIASAGDGTVSFSWSYLTADVSTIYDPFGYFVDTDFFQLTNDTGTQAQSGTASFAVVAGQIFGFRITSIDNNPDKAQVTISSFMAPDVNPPVVVPEIGLAGMGGVFALIAGGFGLLERRRRRT